MLKKHLAYKYQKSQKRKTEKGSKVHFKSKEDERPYKIYHKLRGIKFQRPFFPES